jgi:hypothetical protein
MGQGEDGEEVFGPANTSAVHNPVVNTIKNEFEQECLDTAITLLILHLIRQLLDDCDPGHMYSIPGLPGTKFLLHWVGAIWFIVRRWVWDAHMPGALVADEIDLGQTFTSGAAAMFCQLVPEKLIMELALSILWGNTLEERAIMAHNNCPRIIGEEWV